MIPHSVLSSQTDRTLAHVLPVAARPPTTWPRKRLPPSGQAHYPTRQLVSRLTSRPANPPAANQRVAFDRALSATTRDAHVAYPRPTPTARHASVPPWTPSPLSRWVERERGADERRAEDNNTAREEKKSRVGELEIFFSLSLFIVAGDATGGARQAARIGLSFGCGSRDGDRHLRRMFDWNDDQQQVRRR